MYEEATGFRLGPVKRFHTLLSNSTCAATFWRFTGKDDLVEFAVTSWGGCNMPHIKIGFPTAPGNAGGADKADKTDPCADHPYVDIQQMTSTKSYCTGPPGRE